MGCWYSLLEILITFSGSIIYLFKNHAQSMDTIFCLTLHLINSDLEGQEVSLDFMNDCIESFYIPSHLSFG